MKSKIAFGRFTELGDCTNWCTRLPHRLLRPLTSCTDYIKKHYCTVAQAKHILHLYFFTFSNRVIYFLTTIFYTVYITRKRLLIYCYFFVKNIWFGMALRIIVGSSLNPCFLLLFSVICLIQVAERNGVVTELVMICIPMDLTAHIFGQAVDLLE